MAYCETSSALRRWLLCKGPEIEINATRPLPRIVDPETPLILETNARALDHGCCSPSNSSAASPAVPLISTTIIFPFRRFSTASEQIAELYVRQSFAAQMMTLLPRAMFFAGQLETFLHGAERNHISFRINFHGEAINDGQRERKADRKGGPWPFWLAT